MPAVSTVLGVLAAVVAAPVPPQLAEKPPLLLSVAVPAVRGHRGLELGGGFDVVLTNTSDKSVRVWRDWCSWGVLQPVAGVHRREGERPRGVAGRQGEPRVGQELPRRGRTRPRRVDRVPRVARLGHLEGPRACAARRRQGQDARAVQRGPRRSVGKIGSVDRRTQDGVPGVHSREANAVNCGRLGSAVASSSAPLRCGPCRDLAARHLTRTFRDLMHSYRATTSR